MTLAHFSGLPMTVVDPPTATARAHNNTHADDGNGIGLGINGRADQDLGRNKVSNNEGAAAPRQQGARRENTLAVFDRRATPLA
jgi:hypothetical protein